MLCNGTIGGVTYSFVYDRENRLSEVKQGATSLATFVYDTNSRNRVKGTVGGAATLYLDEIYEYVVGTGATTKYYEGNTLRRTGYAADNGVFYLSQDPLHSSPAPPSAKRECSVAATPTMRPLAQAVAGRWRLQADDKKPGHWQVIPGQFGRYERGFRFWKPRFIYLLPITSQPVASDNLPLTTYQSLPHPRRARAAAPAAWAQRRAPRASSVCRRATPA